MRRHLIAPCLMVVVVVAAAGCGGGGGGDSGVSASPSVASVSDLDDSQRAALRDLNLYDESTMSVDDPVSPLKAFSTKAQGTIAAKIAGALAKEAIHDAGREVSPGLDGRGEMIFEYSIDGEAGEDVATATFTATVTVDDYYQLGKCDQTVYCDGLIRCDADLQVLSTGDATMHLRCSTDGPLSYEGSDAVPHRVAYDYSATMEGNAFDETIALTALSGLIGVDEITVRMEDLGEAPACTNPEVSDVDPPDNAFDVAVDQPVSITFTEEMDQQSVEDAFVFTCGGFDLAWCSPVSIYSTSTVDGAFSWEGKKMVFTPSAPLEYDSCYSIYLPEGVKSSTGYPMAAELSQSFTTAAEPPP